MDRDHMQEFIQVITNRNHLANHLEILVKLITIIALKPFVVMVAIITTTTASSTTTNSIHFINNAHIQ